MSYKGRFFPKHPTKYIGDTTSIVYRSNWERTFMNYCDTNPAVVRWSSEELYIPYYFTGDRKWHRYYPDFMVEYQTAAGPRDIWVIEVKPHKQLRPPVIPTTAKPKRRHLREMMEYSRNQAKWAAADAYCTAKGWKFKVLTEKTLYPTTI